jgi:hypothetical protein
MPAFTLEEAGRIEALRAAGELLRDLGLLHAESGTVDLINLAFFIHTGLDPHDSRLGRQPAFPDAAEWDAQAASDT